jgi:hypothetical protein
MMTVAANASMSFDELGADLNPTLTDTSEAANRKLGSLEGLTSTPN